MKRAIISLVATAFLVACTTAPPKKAELPPLQPGLPVGFFFDPATPQGESAIVALRKRLASRYIQLGAPRFGSEKDYEYLYVPASWESFGWEGVYHTDVLFFRNKGALDWSDSVVFSGTSGELPTTDVREYARKHAHFFPIPPKA